MEQAVQSSKGWAPAFIGMETLVRAKVLDSGGEDVKMRCVIHQEVLCAKTIQLGNVMNTVMET